MLLRLRNVAIQEVGRAAHSLPPPRREGKRLPTTSVQHGAKLVSRHFRLQLLHVSQFESGRKLLSLALRMRSAQIPRLLANAIATWRAIFAQAPNHMATYEQLLNATETLLSDLSCKATLRGFACAASTSRQFAQT